MQSLVTEYGDELKVIYMPKTNNIIIAFTCQGVLLQVRKVKEEDAMATHKWNKEISDWEEVHIIITTICTVKHGNIL